MKKKTRVSEMHKHRVYIHGVLLLGKNKKSETAPNENVKKQIHK